MNLDMNDLTAIEGAMLRELDAEMLSWFLLGDSDQRPEARQVRAAYHGARAAILTAFDPRRPKAETEEAALADAARYLDFIRQAIRRRLGFAE